MNILHICSYYIGSKVYRELISKIDEVSNKSIIQYIYIPLRKEKDIGKNKINIENIKFSYRKIYNQLDRILFFRKIKKAFKDIQKEIDINKIDYIHAHTIFADGMIAYKINKKYGKKYIVAVRNSDVYAYLKYMPFAKIYLNKVIKNASKVIFISPSMKKNIEKKLRKKIKREFEKKIEIIPNGIEDFWIENINSVKDIKEKGELSLLQVSSIDKNKNLDAAFNIIKELKKIGIKARLTVVGSGKKEKLYKDKIQKDRDLRETVMFTGGITDKKVLQDIYRQHDIFIMLSKKETFGLVYIEAMSQGLPVIYSKGTGIDGYFENKYIGVAVNTKKPIKELDEIIKINKNYRIISENVINESLKFNWKSITQNYIDKIYTKEVNNEAS